MPLIKISQCNVQVLILKFLFPEKTVDICDPILENQPYRGIIDFEIWLYKVIAGVVGQK